MRSGDTKVGQFFLKGIGFMEWVQLHPDDVKKLPIYDVGCHSRVFICADVNSLQILWEENDQESGRVAIAHETVDYDAYSSAQKLLDEQVFDDSQQYWEDGRSIWTLTNDCLGKDFSNENPPRIMTFAEIRAEFIKKKAGAPT